jgi:GTPase SAR1 family protein
MSATVTLSLISHTNVGKTTLARTLLRRDVGEVLDQAHVTEENAAYTLIETEGAALRLWDTPGFGDTGRLMRRLRREREPLGWFLHQVWDRIADRSLFCSQRAVHNVREEADVVLYIVNASEDPGEAGYVVLELEILNWIGRPVLLLLNQVSPTDAGIETRWRALAAERPLVRDVLSMDAFGRCWTEEGVLLQRVVGLLDGQKRDAMAALTAAWTERDLAVFRSSCEVMARYLARAAADREAPARGAGESGSGWLGVLGELTGALKLPLEKRRAMAALARRLDRSTQELMGELIAAHGLVGGAAATIEKRVEDVEVRGGPPFSARSGALAGAVMSGAIGGLVADVLTGGLSLGGGMLAGGMLGALGGSVIGGAYRFITGQKEPSVQWTAEFLDRLLRQTLLRYLAVAHFGRGRGPYREQERPGHWSEAVETGLKPREARLHGLWKDADENEDVDDLRCDLAALIGVTLREVLRRAHPQARQILAD